MDGINYVQFKHEIIRPVLKGIGLWSQAAENLLLGTAVTESKLKFLRQISGGPALGVYQIEKATHYDIVNNYLKYRLPLKHKVNGYAGHSLSGEKRHLSLIGNLNYATAMARVFYRRIKEPLPHYADARGLAEYHKKYYNTLKGKTEVSKSMAYFWEAINSG